MQRQPLLHYPTGGLPPGRTLACAIVWISASVTAALGGDPTDWIGLRIKDRIHPDDVPTYVADVASIAAGQTVIRRLRVRDHQGQYHWIEVHAKTFLDVHGSPDGQVASLRVVDAEVAADRELKRLARLDVLTGVLNRAEALARLEYATTRPRDPGRGNAMLFCDVDMFKAINDSLGHAAGDAVLRVLSRRITESVRRDDIVARVGGDEFLVFLMGIHNAAEAAMIAEKIRSAAAVPIPLGDGRGTIRSSLSIGVALAVPGELTDALIARADAAMYQAKRAGRDRVILRP